MEIRLYGINLTGVLPEIYSRSAQYHEGEPLGIYATEFSDQEPPLMLFTLSSF